MVRFMDLCFSFQEIRCDQRQRTHDNQLRSREDLPWGTNRRTDNTLIGRFCQRPPEARLVERIATRPFALNAMAPKAF